MSEFDEMFEATTRAIRERDMAVSQRADNMWKGPIGIEERIQMLQADIDLTNWMVLRLLQVLKDERTAAANPEANAK